MKKLLPILLISSLFLSACSGTKNAKVTDDSPEPQQNTVIITDEDRISPDWQTAPLKALGDENTDTLCADEVWLHTAKSVWAPSADRPVQSILINDIDDICGLSLRPMPYNDSSDGINLMTSDDRFLTVKLADYLFGDELSQYDEGNSFTFWSQPAVMLFKDDKGFFLSMENEGDNTFLYLAENEDGINSLQIDLYNSDMNGWTDTDFAWEFVQALISKTELVKTEEMEDRDKLLCLSFVKGSCEFPVSQWSLSDDLKTVTFTSDDGLTYEIACGEIDGWDVKRAEFYAQYDKTGGDSNLEGIFPCAVLQREDGSYIIQDHSLQYYMTVK